MHYTLNFGDLLPYAQFFTDGLALTAKIALIVTIFGTLLGILGAVVRNSPKHGVLYHLWTGYVELIRNTPFIIQLFFIFFGLPQLGLHFSADSAAVLALIINLGAYNTEIVRAGLAVTSPGQWEAARCLGLTRRQTYIHVVLPPAIRKIYPALVGQCVLVMLGSAVISQISCEDLTYAASYVQSVTFRSFECYIVSTVLYLLLALFMKHVLLALSRLWFRGDILWTNSQTGTSSAACSSPCAGLSCSPSSPSRAERSSPLSCSCSASPAGKQSTFSFPRT